MNQAEQVRIAARVAEGHNRMEQWRRASARDGQGARNWALKHMAGGHDTLPTHIYERMVGNPDELAAVKANALAALRGETMSEQLLREILTRLERIEAKLDGGANTAVSSTQADGSFQATEMTCTVDKGKMYWKVRGGQFTKFGIIVWPEVLLAAGFEPENMDPLKAVDLTGYMAHYVTNEDGKAQKIVSLVRPSAPNGSPLQPTPELFSDRDMALQAKTHDNFDRLALAMLKNGVYSELDHITKTRQLIDPNWVPGSRNDAMLQALETYHRSRKTAEKSDKPLKQGLVEAMAEARGKYHQLAKS